MNPAVVRGQPRPLLILGRAANAADLALRRILHAKERGQTVVVADYQGSLAAMLSDRNKGNLQNGPMLWCDLANRRRPTSLFQIKKPGANCSINEVRAAASRFGIANLRRAIFVASPGLARTRERAWLMRG